MPSGCQVFVVSCAPEDEGLREELAMQLSLLERQGYVSSWSDRKITTGCEWKGQIDERLESSQIILLLVSPDFIASDYCFDVELKRALERHKRSEARVIPIILRHVNWREAPFARLQALPINGRPVTDFPVRDKAFTQIADGIRGAVRKLRGEQAISSWSWLPLPNGTPFGIWLLAAAVIAALFVGAYFW